MRLYKLATDCEYFVHVSSATYALSVVALSRVKNIYFKIINFCDKMIDNGHNWMENKYG